MPERAPTSRSISRPDYDDNGLRYAKCLACDMGWIEGRESVELIPGTGEFTQAGERTHECPEPFSFEVATAMAEAAKALGGIVVSQKVKAQIKLGLERGAS